MLAARRNFLTCRLPVPNCREAPGPLALPEVTPATRLLEKRRQQFEADEKLQAAKAAYAAQVGWCGS